MTATTKNKGDVDIERLPVDSEEHIFQDWTVKYRKSHILHSLCTTADKCKNDTQDACLLCVYKNSLSLPHLPEMVFPNNVFTLLHNSGAQIEFNALDALKAVSNGKLPVKVSYTEAWRETRPPEFLGQKIKPFDWTFSNDYKGTTSGPIHFEETELRINYEKLKEKEKILFYQELMLYEDELHDNGITTCSLRIRVMPSSFFVLLRLFVRVDNVMLRINDTRYYHEFGTDYLIREFTNKECAFNEVHLPLTVFGDPNALSPHMPLRTAIHEKLTFSKIQKENPEESTTTETTNTSSST